MNAKILVVEGDPSVLSLETTVIKRMNYQVLSASNAEDAYEIVRREKPDAILLDIDLPGRDGYALAQKLKSGSTTQEIPFGFVSGKAEPVQIGKGFQIGGIIFLTKPFTVNALKTTVETLLKYSPRTASNELKTQPVVSS